MISPPALRRIRSSDWEIVVAWPDYAIASYVAASLSLKVRLGQTGWKEIASLTQEQGFKSAKALGFISQLTI